jgi:hypothetical protein
VRGEGVDMTDKGRTDSIYEGYGTNMLEKHNIELLKKDNAALTKKVAELEKELKKKWPDNSVWVLKGEITTLKAENEALKKMQTATLITNEIMKLRGEKEKLEAWNTQANVEKDRLYAEKEKSIAAIEGEVKKLYDVDIKAGDTGDAYCYRKVLAIIQKFKEGE